MKAIRLAGSAMVLGLGAGCSGTGVEPQPGPDSAAEARVEERAAKPAPATRPDRPKGSITEVDLNRLLQLQDEGKAYLIDVRPPLFYGMGHIPGAVNVPKKSFPLSLARHQAAVDAAVAEGKVLVLYCQNVQCPDGYAVGREMAAMGYSTSLYKGGWEQWRDMGF